MNTINKKQTAILFCRVSSKEQEETGYSLPSQKKLLTDYSQAKDYKIDKIFSLSESAGGHKQRKVFLEMLEYLNKSKIKILVVEKTDRLTRNMRDAVAVNSWIDGDEERQVHFVKENFILQKNSKSNDKFIWGIKVTTAQYYLDNLSEEVKKGQKEKLQQGWLPTTPPYGYKTIGDKGHKIHILDEKMAPLIKEMFNLYATGEYSLQKLTLKMREMGLRSSQGGKVHRSRIHALLTNPFYIGKNVWLGKVTPGQQEHLIDDDIFEKVGMILTRKSAPYYTKHEYLFKGLFRCVSCGGLITWEEHKGFVYGHCNHRRDGCSACKWTKEEKVEEQIVDELASFKIDNPKLMKWLSKALKETNKMESNLYLNSISELEKNREISKKRLDAIYIDKIDGKITQDYYNLKFDEFSKDLESIDKNISKLTKITNSEQTKKADLYDLAQQGREKYLEGKPEKRRELIRMVFNNLKLNGSNVIFELDKNYLLLKNLAEKTNSSKMGKLIDSGNKIFEQYDLTKVYDYYASSHPECSVVLPRLDSNQGPIAYKKP